MIYTGTFSIMDSFLLTCQRAHPDNHAFDDDVVSRSAEWERDPAAKDGFVSNVGDNVTIHLKQEQMENDETITLVKRYFACRKHKVSSPSLACYSQFEVCFNQLTDCHSYVIMNFQHFQTRRKI